MEKMLTGRQILEQQWYLTRFCFRKAPGFMLYHLFESVKLQISIFMEFTWTVNYVLNVVEQGEDFCKVLWCMGLLMAGIALSTVTFAIYKQYMLPRMRPVLYQALRMEIYEKAKELDLACYDDKDFYEQFILTTGETDQCIDRYLEYMDVVVGRLAGTLSSLVYSLLINPVALLMVLLILPVEIYLVIKENRKTVEARMERLSYEQKREYGNRVFYLADYAGELRLYPEMKQKCRADYEAASERIREINRNYGKRLFVLGAFRDTVLGWTVLEGIVWTVLLYQMLVLQTLSGTGLITSRSCIRRLRYNMESIIDGCRMAAENAEYIYRIRALLQKESNMDCSGQEKVPEGSGGLQVKHVEFSYLPGKPVLKNINLNVRPGQKIALVGYNGSGKTTLVKLLLRLYDPSAGCIRYHSRDIRDYQISDYRRSVGSVFQDFKIYAASLKENVLMDVEDGSREESYLVEKALYDAHFTLEDRRLAYQIQTPLTTEFEKEGVNLSGGEAQKVAIARTLYRKQDLIIMDEPSSALDPLAEYRLNQELNQIAKDKTVIFISHRLSTTRDADCIYMMVEGRIVEAGTHEELLQREGKYAAMWKIQAGLYA